MYYYQKIKYKLMKRTIILFTLLFGLALTSFGQSIKIQEKALEKLNKFNEPLIEAKVGLSDEQKENLTKIYIEQIKEVNTFKKTAGKDFDKEAIKEINKKYSKKIYQEILTKEQKKARKEAKNNY
jgi:hypothetical protein